MIEVYVLFHELKRHWYHRTTSKMRKNPVNHCGVMLKLMNKSLIYYNTGPDIGCRLTWAERYLKRYPPFTTIHIGKTDLTFDECADLAKEECKITPWKLVLWEALKLRWWNPQSCGAFTSNLLRSLGYHVKIHVAPDTLLKELRNANNYVEWKGESWKDLVGTRDC
tara:strand:- start:211 stop:708 length:498 start_codon:yes stop_codon:yes gene_type:complete